MLQYPIFRTALAPVASLAQIYYAIPFTGLIAFFALYFGVVNNQNLDRSVRFNALQAVLLDIILMCVTHANTVLHSRSLNLLASCEPLRTFVAATCISVHALCYA